MVKGREEDMVTINDIAKLAGVAKSTVSRYLNGGSVSRKTKEALDRIIKETEYVPNTFAQSLKVKQSNLIGIIIPRLNSYATNEILQSVDRCLREKSYQLLIVNTDQDVEREVENLYALSRQKVAGIILLATDVTRAHKEAMEKIGIPVLLLGQRSDATYAIVHEEEEAGAAMGRHALRLGHKKILYLGVTEKDESVGILRKKGVMDVLKNEEGIDVQEEEVDFNFDITFQFLKEYLKGREETYILCATDNIALAAYKASITLGRKVPEDVSISGFGGYSITDLVTPSITTVRYAYKEMGRIAAENLLRLLQGEEIPKKIALSGEFLPKESTKAL